MSRQIAPVTELMFGCQIFVTNFTYTIRHILLLLLLVAVVVVVVNSSSNSILLTQMKHEKALRETQTLHAGCRGAKKNCPAADPLPGGTGRPKFNQLETVTTFTYKPSLVRIDARNFEFLW